MVKFSPVLEFILPHLCYIGLDMIAAAASAVKCGALITLVIATSFHKLRAMETHMFVCHIHCDTLDNKHKYSACLQAGVHWSSVFLYYTVWFASVFPSVFFPVCLIDLRVFTGFHLSHILSHVSSMPSFFLLSHACLKQDNFPYSYSARPFSSL